MRRHAFSHALAALVSSVAAGLLVGEVRRRLPNILDALNVLSFHIVDALNVRVGISSVSTGLLAALLAAVWGAAFAVAHDQRRTH